MTEPDYRYSPVAVSSDHALSALDDNPDLWLTGLSKLCPRCLQTGDVLYDSFLKRYLIMWERGSRDSVAGLKELADANFGCGRC